MIKKTIVLLHYRYGGRDGVSLEMEKRARIIRELGYRTAIICGENYSRNPDVYTIPKLMPRTKDIEKLFSQSDGPLLERKLKEQFTSLENDIRLSVLRIFLKLKPEMIFVHNMFSYPWNLPATFAIISLLRKLNIPTVSVDHDFWQERELFQKTKSPFLRNQLQKLPPKEPFIVKHQVLNSLATEILKGMKIKDGEIISDYFNFSLSFIKKQPNKEKIKRALGIDKEIVFLQATRIVKRKAIENAIRFVAAFQKISGKKSLLLFSNAIEEKKNYLRRLEHLARQENLRMLWGQDFFKNSFWNAYYIADFVTYPSIWEGFGNQFLEAIAFKKLPILFEYPVFRKDIKKEGYQYISLGKKTYKKNGFHLVPKEKIEEAAKELIKLSRGEIDKLTARNIRIARSYHSESVLKENLRKILSRS